MNISPRNQFCGVIQKVQQGAVSGTVDVGVGNLRIVACLSNAGINELGLQTNDSVTVFFSAFDVVISDSNTAFINTFSGTLTSINLGAVCAEIRIALDSGFEFVAVVLNREVLAHALTEGESITISINPMKVFIGID